MKILLLTDLYQQSVCHDRFFETPYLDRTIIKKNLDTDIYLWGPGIDGESVSWDQPAETKIEKRFGDKYYFDIIIQLPGGGILDTTFYSNNKSKTLICIHFLEVPNDIDIDIIERLKPHLVFYISNENALNRFFSKKFTNIVIGAFPIYQSETLAKKFYNEKKVIDILTIGNIDSTIYPERKRLVNIANMLNKKNNGKYKIYHKHTVSFSSDTVDEVIKMYPTMYNTSISQSDEYNRLINSAKIVFCTTHAKIPQTGVKHSSFRLRKFSEIGMSSALRIGSISDEDHFNLANINPIDIEHKTDDEILAQLIYLLESEEERNRKVLIQNKYEEQFTTCKFVEKIIYCYNMYQQKKYGYFNFSQFHMGY